MSNYWWVSPAITIVLFVIGGAATWGRFDQKQKGFCKSLAALETRLEKFETKVDAMQTQCGSVVGTSKCEDNQEKCKKELDDKMESFSNKLDEQASEIHKRIDSVLSTVNGHMIDISKFMGKVQGLMENNKGG